MNARHKTALFLMERFHQAVVKYQQSDRMASAYAGVVLPDKLLQDFVNRREIQSQALARMDEVMACGQTLYGDGFLVDAYCIKKRKENGWL